MAATTPRMLVLGRLSRAEPLTLSYHPERESLEEIKARLDLLSLKKARLQGRLVPLGRRDWRLEAEIGATATQPCAITLNPVTTRIDTPLVRTYLEGYSEPQEAEAEVPEDDSQEPLPREIDLDEILAEALALALPDFPRAPGADFQETTAAPPGAAPIDRAETNPFQALSALKGKEP